MIHVRRHTRQLGSGKTVRVRQHERSGDPSQSVTHAAGTWWDGSGDPVPEGDYPPGTSFFRQGDDVFAVHPDGATYPVTASEDDGPDPSPREARRPWEDEQERLIADHNAEFEREMAPLYTQETDEGTETLPVDPSVGRRAEDRGAWGGPPRGWDDTPSPASRDASPSLARMQAEMRHWRSLPAPETGPVEPDTSPKGRLLGLDTQEGAENFARLRAYREAGYDGPLDQDNRIPDPDDPANHESLSALARMSEI
jgi:hypothetical protein